MSAQHQVWLEPTQTAVEPGQEATCTVWIENVGDVVDQYDLEVLGAPAAWTAVEPGVVALFPGKRGSATLRFRPPRSWDVAAGATPFAARVVSRSAGPQSSVVEEGTVDVRPFVAIDAALAPQASRGWLGGRHRVRVTNAGNAPTPVQLSASDPEEVLRFTFRPPAMMLGAGSEVAASLRVRAPAALGSEEVRQFQVVVEAHGAPPVRLAGSVRQYRLPAGKFVKWAAVGVAALVAVVLLQPHVGQLLQVVGARNGPSTSQNGQPSGGPQPSGGQPSPGASGQPSGQPTASHSPGGGGTTGGSRTQAWAYAWANQPTTPTCYTPSATYQFNTSGGPNTVCRTGTGAYTLNLPGLGGQGGMVHVTAYGGGPESCKVGGWFTSGTTEAVNVLCFDAGGAPADTFFTASFTRATSVDPGTAYAYVWADQPSAASYTPSRAYQWNSTGATDLVTHDSGPGTYVVHLPGLGAAAGHVQVTAYGTGSERCKVSGWGPSGSEQQVRVSCTTASGSPVDTRFTMTYARNRSVLSPDDTHPGTQTGYAWADQPTSASYTPSAVYQFDDAGSGIGITRSGTGAYLVKFASLGADGDVQVTAYGSGNGAYCKVSGWSTGGVGVRCFAPGGAPVDSLYAVTLLRPA